MTSTDVKDGPTFYMGQSIVSSAQAAAKSHCPKANAPDCLSSMEAATNPQNELTVQARAAPLPLIIAAVVALVAVIVEYNELSKPGSFLGGVMVAPEIVTSISSVQSSASIAFVSGSGDLNPVIVPLTSDAATGTKATTTKTGGTTAAATG